MAGIVGNAQASPPNQSTQRDAVLVGFLGWTLDAFDFFILTFVISDVAATFRRSTADIALALTLTLAMRPVGAIVFGLMADRYGRRLPLILNVIFYATISVLSGLAPSYRAFLLLRMLFGVGMGGEWGVGASLALESVSPKSRGLLSGLLQEGYAMGYLLAAVAYRTIYPIWGWRAMFFTGGVPALLSLFIRWRVKESEAWREHRLDWPEYRRSLVNNWRRFAYLVTLMTSMHFIAHGTQDMYPTFLQRERLYSVRETADITIISMIGAILGGLTFGSFSDRIGRRRAIVISLVGALVLVPLWINAPSTALTVVGVFLLQFFVQGAWGVIPAHLNELSPGHLRGFLPGFAYQLGSLCSSSITYIEARLGEHLAYSRVMGVVAATVLLAGIVAIASGPENKSIAFRKHGSGVTM